jgi:hypothetical protein
MRKVTLPVLIILFVLQARPANNFALTVDNIMRGPALVGYEPTGVHWSYDGSRLLFQWKQSTEKKTAPMDTYTVNRGGSGRRNGTAEEVRQLPPQSATPRTSASWRTPAPARSHTADNTTGR